MRRVSSRDRRGRIDKRAQQNNQTNSEQNNSLRGLTCERAQRHGMQRHGMCACACMECARARVYSRTLRLTVCAFCEINYVAPQRPLGMQRYINEYRYVQTYSLAIEHARALLRSIALCAPKMNCSKVGMRL